MFGLNTIFLLLLVIGAYVIIRALVGKSKNSSD
jgi:hypothetical protein